MAAPARNSTSEPQHHQSCRRIVRLRHCERTDRLASADLRHPRSFPVITPAAGAAPSAGNPARRHTPRRAHICVPRDIPDRRVSNKHTIVRLYTRRFTLCCIEMGTCRPVRPVSLHFKKHIPLGKWVCSQTYPKHTLLRKWVCVGCGRRDGCCWWRPTRRVKRLE